MGWARVRRGQQRRLAGVGQPHEADVGEQLELQVEPLFVAGQALFGKTRHPPGGGDEADVAAAAFGAAGHDHALALDGEVGQQAPVGVAHLGADRHLDQGRLAGLAVAVLAGAVAAALTLEMDLVAEVGEIAELPGGGDHDVTPGTAVAAVGTAARHVFSRRKLTEPAPPLPPHTLIEA